MKADYTTMFGVLRPIQNGCLQALEVIRDQSTQDLFNLLVTIEQTDVPEFGSITKTIAFEIVRDELKARGVTR